MPKNVYGHGKRFSRDPHLVARYLVLEHCSSNRGFRFVQIVEEVASFSEVYSVYQGYLAQHSVLRRLLNFEGYKDSAEAVSLL